MPLPQLWLLPKPPRTSAGGQEASPTSPFAISPNPKNGVPPSPKLTWEPQGLATGPDKAPKKLHGAGG